MTEPHPLVEQLLAAVGATTGEAPSNETWHRLLDRLVHACRESDEERDVDRHRVAEGEAIIRATLEATLDAMLVVDMARRVVGWNARFMEMFEIPAELMETRDHRRILAAASRLYLDPAAMLAGTDALFGTNLVSQEQMRLVDGRVVDQYSAPVRLPTGEAVGRVTYLRDVTAERTATDVLERQRQAAEAASSAKSMFVANMSHELRTPLNAVIGLADLLLLQGGDPLTKRQREYVEGIVTSGRHLLAQVNDVLDLAKIEAGKHEIVAEPVSTKDAVDEAVQLLQAIAVQRGVALTADCDPDVPFLRADPVRLRQILYNLISNAVKFTDRGGSVEVSAEAVTMGVVIRVSDTGIGIAPEDIHRLFRSFEQLKLPSGDRPGGTGLGLALTKRLVEMHGGSIDVLSSVGAGSTFTVRFPVG